MEDTKICIKCNVEKLIGDFPIFKNRDGTRSHRNVCKVCFNEQSKNSRVKSKVIKHEIPVEYKIERNIYSMLSKEQIESLAILADKKDDLLSLLDTKIELYSDDNKANRTVRAINLDNKTYDFIKEKSKKTHLSYSDIINSMLKKAMEYMD